MRDLLIDAGPLVAFFAPDDKHHARIDAQIAALAEPGLRLLSTWPCVVEAANLLDPPQRLELLRWIELGGIQVYPFERHHLGKMVDRMRRHPEPGKREMDLADASLYWLAAETGIAEVLTIDLADFSRYRLPDGRMFSLL